MKYCPKCQANVGAPFEYCPICQNELHAISESKESNELAWYPGCRSLKKMSLVYKIQLFVFLSICVICLALDYLYKLHGEIHWSLIVVLWIMGIEIVIGPLLKRKRVPAYFLTMVAILITCIFAITAYFIGDMKVCTHIQIPIIVLVTLAVNFVFSLTDKSGNALVFALCNVLVGIIPNMVMLSRYRETPVLWSVCLIVSIILLLALIIFKGKQVYNEIEKRLNI